MIILSLTTLFVGASESVTVVNTMAAGGGISTLVSLLGAGYYLK